MLGAIFSIKCVLEPQLWLTWVLQNSVAFFTKRLMEFYNEASKEPPTKRSKY